MGCPAAGTFVVTYLLVSVVPKSFTECGWGDLNSHVLRHRNLNPARLPIPPHPLASTLTFGCQNLVVRMSLVAAPLAAALSAGLLVGPAAEGAFAAKKSKVRVTIVGVKQGMVTISGGGQTRVVKRSSTLRLTPGRYRVNAMQVSASGTWYSPKPKRQSFRVVRGSAQALTVAYVAKGGGGDKIPPDPVPGGQIGRVVELVNAARATTQKCGTVAMGPSPALKYNDALAKAAQLHADDMAANNYLSHDSLDGRTVVDRIKAAGYPGAPGGENIARGLLDADGVVRDWLDSPVHCTALMDPDFASVGIGLAYRDEAAGRVVYWVQDFGWD